MQGELHTLHTYIHTYIIHTYIHTLDPRLQIQIGTLFHCCCETKKGESPIGLVNDLPVKGPRIYTRIMYTPRRG